THPLLNHQKHITQHTILLHLPTNHIHTITKLPTSKITNLIQIHKYQHLIHILTQLLPQLNHNLSPITLIPTLLPTPTLSPPPKLTPIQTIYQPYPFKPPIYTPALAYINSNHNLHFPLPIPTILI
ncbi:chorismate-binding protein, partial [Staphylococcus capitis]|uniref:chorismate-binding protein n=1 Tax=Staphylococcus capitis TaxID=29388 RepID=UPI0016424869